MRRVDQAMIATTQPIVSMAEITTAWRVVARQPLHSMRWCYFVPIADLRDEAAHRLIETCQRRDPDAYVLLARIRP